ncbi:MAG: hypothetical protein ISS56_00860 [Anaerolineae bacterium]|nr:hypothetical protein [Anaerolineae bacterium]
MKIVAADIYDTDLHQWKPPIILRLMTDEGIYGLGEFPLAYGTGRQGAIGMLKDLVERFVIGADPMRIESMWHTLFRRTFWAQGGGPIVYGGMSTIDEALWDIKGKALGCPIYELHVQPHNCHGPIATAAAAQVDACITNFVIQELVPFRDRIAYELVHEPLELLVRDGQMPVPEGPGLAVTLNEELVARCPRVRIE